MAGFSVVPRLAAVGLTCALVGAQVAPAALPSVVAKYEARDLKDWNLLETTTDLLGWLGDASVAGTSEMAPNGTPTGIKVVDDSMAAFESIVESGPLPADFATYTLEVSLKAGLGSTETIVSLSLNGGFADCIITWATASTPAGTGCIHIGDEGSGWHRYNLMASNDGTAGGSFTFEIFPSTDGASAVGDVIVWHPVLALGGGSPYDENAAAAEGYLGFWMDRSGLGHDLIQAAEDMRFIVVEDPIPDKRGAMGTSKLGPRFMENTAVAGEFAITNPEITAFFAMVPGPSSIGVSTMDIASLFGPTARLIFRKSGADRFQFRILEDDGTTKHHVASLETTPFVEPVFYTARFDPPIMDVWIDGVHQGRKMTDPTVDTALTTFHLGSAFPTETVLPGLRIATTLHDAALSDGKVRNVLRPMAQRYDGSSLDAAAPDTVSDLVLWLDGDEDVSFDTFGVHTWLDQSGMGNDATQSVDTLKPALAVGKRNGHDCVYFTKCGTSPYPSCATDKPGMDLVAGPFVGDLDSMTLFTVFISDSWSGHRRPAVQGGGGWFVGLDGRLSSGRDGSGSFLLGPLVRRFDPVLWEVVKAGGAYQAGWANNLLTSGPTGNTLGPGALSLGSSGSIPGRLAGWICEVAIYDRVLSFKERTRVRQYLREKYKLPAMP